MTRRIGSKKTLLLRDPDAVYVCAFSTRNGSCTNAPVVSGVGPRRLTMCRRHKTFYDAEMDRLMKLLQSEHASGLHADNREEFAVKHVREDFWELACEACDEEMVSIEMGVPTALIEQAKKIRTMMLRDREKEIRLDQMFREALTSNKRPVFDLVDEFYHRASSIAFHHSLWEAVIARTGRGMNYVEAYQDVQEEVKQRLIQDLYAHDNTRRWASSWLAMNPLRGGDFEKGSS